MKLDKTLILNRIKFHYNFKSDIQLAKFLAIAPTTLSNWYSRNTMDFDLVFIKCGELNPNWIITGEGNPAKLYAHQEQNKPSLIEDILGKYIGNSSKKTNIEEDIQLLYSVITLQETTIVAQQKTIDILEKIKKK